jgi:hypothetical protein
MRLPLLALLWFGTAAFGQSPAPQKVDPDNLFQMPKKFTPTEREFGKLRPQPFVWNKSIQAYPTLLIPSSKLKDAPQIDPPIIGHPLWRSKSEGTGRLT